MLFCKSVNKQEHNSTAEQSNNMSFLLGFKKESMLFLYNFIPDNHNASNTDKAMIHITKLRTDEVF